MRHVSLTWSFRLSIVAIASFFLGCQLWSLFSARGIYPVTHYGRAGDFRGFFSTVQAALDYGSMDLGGLFFKPPFFAVVLSGLVPLGFESAAVLYQIALTAVVVAVIITACWIKAWEFWTICALSFVILCSHPFQFLVDRGNVDAFSLASVLFAAIAQQVRVPVLAALLFAIGFHLKSNVIVFLPMLIMHRSVVQTGWSSILIALCTLLIAGLTPAWILQWFHVAFERVGWQTLLWENGSIFRAFAAVPYGEWIAWLVLGVSSVLIIAGCIRRIVSVTPPTRFDLCLLCSPICQAYPKQAFLYGYVFLPLLLLLYPVILSRPGAHWTERYFGVVGCVGVVLSCFPSGFLVNGVTRSDWAYLPPSIGLVCMLVANSVLVWTAKLSPLEEGEGTRFASTAIGKCVFGLLRAGSWSLVFLLFLVSGYSLAGYARSANSRVLWFAPSILSAEGAPLPGTSFRVRNATQEWGRLRLNKAVYGEAPLMIGGVTYQSGLGTHGRSDMELLLPQGTLYLSGRCGLDDAAGERAEGFVCIILVDQSEVFRSQVIQAPGASDTFRVAVAGASFVTLRVENAASGNNWNHADWVELRVE